MLSFQGDDYYCPNADAMLQKAWFREAGDGRVWVPKYVTNQWAQLIRMTLYGLRHLPRVELLIDCQSGGDKRSFDPCYELWWRHQKHGSLIDPQALATDKTERALYRCETICTCLGNAQSIGLSYLVAGTHRIAMAGSTFMLHGEGQRKGTLRHQADGEPQYMEDWYAANWMARFTSRTEDEWLAYMGDGDTHIFGCEEALEWGVIDEVVEGV